MRHVLVLAALGAALSAAPARAQLQYVPARGTYATAHALGGEVNAGARVAQRFGRFVDLSASAAYFDRTGAVETSARLGTTVPFARAWAVRAEAGARRLVVRRPDVPSQKGFDTSLGVHRRVPLSDVVTGYPALEVRMWNGFDWGAAIPLVVEVSKRVAAGVTTRVGVNSPTRFTFTVQTRLR